ncbi:hypothetical protein HK101_011278 [Irineochytrium annulatum]|nr:hypothetical protein HK101_011278 [Irineochytrium annulatum]
MAQPSPPRPASTSPRLSWTADDPLLFADEPWDAPTLATTAGIPPRLFPELWSAILTYACHTLPQLALTSPICREVRSQCWGPASAAAFLISRHRAPIRRLTGTPTFWQSKDAAETLEMLVRAGTSYSCPLDDHRSKGCFLTRLAKAPDPVESIRRIMPYVVVRTMWSTDADEPAIRFADALQVDDTHFGRCVQRAIEAFDLPLLLALLSPQITDKDNLPRLIRRWAPDLSLTALVDAIGTHRHAADFLDAVKLQPVRDDLVSAIAKAGAWELPVDRIALLVAMRPRARDGWALGRDVGWDDSEFEDRVWTHRRCDEGRVYDYPRRRLMPIMEAGVKPRPATVMGYLGTLLRLPAAIADDGVLKEIVEKMDKAGGSSTLRMPDRMRVPTRALVERSELVQELITASVLPPTFWDDELERLVEQSSLYEDLFATDSGLTEVDKHIEADVSAVLELGGKPGPAVITTAASRGYCSVTRLLINWIQDDDIGPELHWIDQVMWAKDPMVALARASMHCIMMMVARGFMMSGAALEHVIWYARVSRDGVDFLRDIIGVMSTACRQALVDADESGAGWAPEEGTEARHARSAVAAAMMGRYHGFGHAKAVRIEENVSIEIVRLLSGWGFKVVGEDIAEALARELPRLASTLVELE